MFRTVPLSIIRSFSLYTQQCYMSFRFADSLRAGLGNQLDALISQIYFGGKLYMFRTVSLSIIRRFYCTHSNGICYTSFFLTACEQDQDGTAVQS